MIQLNLADVRPPKNRPPSHPPTVEQQHILDLAKTDGVLKVIAGAGTGKTATLVMVADNDPRPTLYMAFNKDMASEAYHRMPDHVVCQTTHSVAFSYFGRALSDAGKLSRPYGAYVNVKGTGREIAIAYKLRGSKKADGSQLPPSVIGNCVLATVAAFEQSADESLWLGHLRLSEHIDPVLCNTVGPEVLRTAKKLWAERIDLSCNTLATHDTYLKLFQLSKNKMDRYEVVMLDEAQDTNACVLDIFNTMSAKLKIMVGDPYQQIYAWRGSVNAMEQVKAKEAFLTESFRFSQGIAEVANYLLNMFEPAKFTVKGLGQTRMVHRQQIIGQHTCLFRTNAGLLSLAMTLIPQGAKVELNTDVKDLVRLVEAAISLQTGNANGVKHPTLMPYNSWLEIVEDSASSPELGRLVKMELDYTLNVVLATLKAYKKPTHPDIVLTTAHKSKGLEYDNGILANDFKDLDDITPEERNLLYVALTRFKKLVALNLVVIDIVNQEIEKNGNDT